MKTRKSGILLHVTSLPSPYGIGDLGPSAYRFADFLADAGQSIWQVLPLNPTSATCGNSPYCSNSAFAGNSLLISPELLVADGLLVESDIAESQRFSSERVDFETVSRFKFRLLRVASERYKNMGRDKYDFERFCEDNAYWLDDYALFVALKEKFGGVAWSDWPREERDRNLEVLGRWKEEIADEVFLEKFLQYLFFKQWSALKGYCKSKNIQVMGDMPIYVNHDSSDVWANPELFKLDEQKRPTHVAGVPPDYFSATGQLWGNPVYRWEKLAETGYAWWVTRMEHNLGLFDMVRMDHFRGFVGYWEVPASEETAIHGKWVTAPAGDFFRTLLRHFPYLPIIAEDLGIITPDVREVMASFGFPGMTVFLFAFGEDLPTNPYTVHNHSRESVVYTGTHDNNTVNGWFRREASQEDKERFCRYIGRDVDGDQVHWELMRLAMMSVSNTAIVPIQDVLGLGEEARMNMPAVTHGNWEWRVTEEQLTSTLAEKLLEMTRLYGRS